jgi:hypothetical protein
MSNQVKNPPPNLNRRARNNFKPVDLLATRLIYPIGDTFSTTAIEIINKLKICSSKSKGFPASCSTGPRRTWNTPFKGQLKLVNGSKIKELIPPSFIHPIWEDSVTTVLV